MPVYTNLSVRPPHKRPDGTVQYWPLRGCTCRWCTEMRELKRVNRAYRTRHDDLDRYMSVEQSETARDRMRAWHARGLSYAEISVHCGVPRSTVDAHLGPTRPRHTMRKSMYDAVMGAAEPLDIRPEGRRRSGLWTDPTAPLRQLQALHTLGFTWTFLSAQLGYVGDHGANLNAFVRREKGKHQVTAETAADISVLYDKFSDQNPLVYGLRKCSVTRARLHARAQGWAPPIAWDDDTIGDPAASPDWTGRCGTYSGHHAHRKAGIPACRPCLDAANGQARANYRKAKNESA